MRMNSSFDELKPGMHIQPDDTFDRDTEHDECCRIDRGDIDYAADSSDDEEDRERKALENWFVRTILPLITASFDAT